VHTSLHTLSTAGLIAPVARRRVVLIAIAAALCLALSASGSALAASSGDTKADYPGTAAAVKLGDTPADFAHPIAAATKIGDTPVDDPGASRAPHYDPPAIITVNRPERTIVHDADEVLPMMLAGAALLIALAGLATALVRTGVRPSLGRSH
jgi:hypothetical protein